MRYLFSLLLCLFLISCIDTRPKETYKTIYEFEDIENVLEKDLKLTTSVILKRLEKLGVEDASVGFNKKQQLTIETTTHIDISQIKAVATNAGDLSFWSLHKTEDLVGLIVDVDTILKEKDSTDNPVSLLNVVKGASIHGTPELFYIDSTDEELVKNIFNRTDVKALFSEHKKQIKLLFGLVDDNGLVPVYAGAVNGYKTAPITEKNIVNARQEDDFIGRPAISIDMDQLSALKWEQMTGEAYENQSQIAIVLNGRVYPAPGVSAGPISGGKSQISGNFTKEEATYIVAILNSGQQIPKLRHVKTLSIDHKE